MKNSTAVLGFLLIIISFIRPAEVHSQYSINSLYGNLIDCDTMTSGIFIVWWDNNWDYSEDASKLLDTMNSYRQYCLNDMNMADPPNPPDGYYYNVYLHHSADLFPSGWGNGQGTDGNGYPFLTLPIGAHNDWVNVAHETFHVFQYSANSPGFSYSGDSQWYIEASANWFAAIMNPENPRAFVEAESLVRLPNVALWLSYNNFPDYYPSNWQRYVHQYAMALLLYYLTEEADVPFNMITEGLFAGTDELPQEYYFNQLGADIFRSHFLNWAAHMTNRFDFLPLFQIEAFENEWDDYADPLDDNEFILVLEDEGTDGWHRPADSMVTTGWSYNTYKLLNQSDAVYTFELDADEYGSAGSPSYYQGKVLVQSSSGEDSFYDLEMDSEQQGSYSHELSSSDTAVYLIIASMPEYFEDVHQLFSYDVRINKSDPVGVENPSDQLPSRKVLGRFDVLGRPAAQFQDGVHLILYDNGDVERVYNLNSR